MLNGRNGHAVPSIFSSLFRTFALKKTDGKDELE
jgi:hypothetical protein